MIVSTIVIVYSGPKIVENLESKKVDVLYPILAAFFYSCINSAITMTNRYWMIKGNMQSSEFCIDAFFMHGITTLIMYIIYSLIAS